MCTIPWFLVYSQSYSTITTVQFLDIFFNQKRNSEPINIHSPIFLPTSPFPVIGNLNLHSVSMHLPILDIPYEWNHKICGILY